MSFNNDRLRRVTYNDVSGKVDPVSHGGDFLKGIQHGSIRAAHGSTILVFGISKLIKTRWTCSLKTIEVMLKKTLVWWLTVRVILVNASAKLITLLIMVVRSPPLRRGFWASPTREGSLVAFSLENVLHSDPTSITRSPERESSTCLTLLF